jgi:hypothetical protein
MVNKSIFGANFLAEMRKVTHLITVLVVHVTVSEGWSTYGNHTGTCTGNHTRYDRPIKVLGMQ